MLLAHIRCKHLTNSFTLQYTLSINAEILVSQTQNTQKSDHQNYINSLKLSTTSALLKWEHHNQYSVQKILRKDCHAFITGQRFVMGQQTAAWSEQDIQKSNKLHSLMRRLRCWLQLKEADYYHYCWNAQRVESDSVFNWFSIQLIQYSTEWDSTHCAFHQSTQSHVVVRLKVCDKKEARLRAHNRTFYIYIPSR